MTVLPWVQTRSGRALDLLEPTSDKITLTDIAYHLARINRFSGAATPPISVARHSLRVAQLLARPASPMLVRAALLHDAHEAYVGDVTTPVKAALVKLDPDFAWTWHRLVSAIQEVIHTKLGLPAILPVDWVEAIQAADLTALREERVTLMKGGERAWQCDDVWTERVPSLCVDLSLRAVECGFMQAVLDTFSEYRRSPVHVTKD